MNKDIEKAYLEIIKAQRETIKSLTDVIEVQTEALAQVMGVQTTLTEEGIQE